MSLATRCPWSPQVDGLWDKLVSIGEYVKVRRG